MHEKSDSNNIETFPSPIKSVTIGQIVDTCDECKFYVINKQQITNGACHGNPPLLMIGPQGPMGARVNVAGNDIACRHFKQ